MANIGDASAAAGYEVVPDTGEEGRVRWGAREINKTRDYIAAIKKLVPTTRAGARTTAGITSGSGLPPTKNVIDGDIYFRYVG